MRNIEEEIKERTQSATKKILERAKKVGEREFAIARKKKEAIVLKGKKDVDRITNMHRNSLNAQLILEYRLKMDNFRDELCSELLNETRGELDNLDDNTVLESLKNLIREGILNLGLNKALVKVNKRSAALLKANYNRLIDFIREKAGSFESMNIDDSLEAYGAIVSSESAGEFFDNTFKRRLERFESEFKEKILERLG